ncbi:MAG TPA: 16S rRNA (cytidine(1402)-2'-O)-methyltransferase, partial [Terracidiphilus sp.]|nr:16S rRNA (cytidine(1402)-2'-O)-methyltransferase [Terracidiphilus sp.]
ALDVLKRVDRIACEDTRHTQKLLNHYQIDAPTESLHEHNEHERTPLLIEALKNGARIAVVTDAGMPGISDPGALLTAAAVAAGIAVIPIPGANAALSAVVASGLPSGAFTYLGFLPEKAGQRRTRLEELAAQPADAPRTVIFYEAPHRIAETLADLEAVFGPGLRIVVARELTKVHEEFLRGTVAEVRPEMTSRDRIRGEMTVVIELPVHVQTGAAGSGTTIGNQVSSLQAELGIDEKEALKRLARELNRSKSELYRELQRERARRSR